MPGLYQGDGFPASRQRISVPGTAQATPRIAPGFSRNATTYLRHLPVSGQPE